MPNKTCSIDDCGLPAESRGWCRKHYVRWQRHGDPLFVKQIQGNDEARFLSKVLVLPNGCWEWQDFINPHGYGTFSTGGHERDTFRAHRWAYAHWKGEISEGHTIDHACHNRSGCAGGVTCPHRRCVNPEHLEATETLAENVARSPNAPQHRTHCPYGHEYTEENTYRQKKKSGGYRRLCRQCHRNSEKARRLGMTRAEVHALGNDCGRGHAVEGDNLIIGSDGRHRCLACFQASGRKGASSRWGDDG